MNDGTTITVYTRESCHLCADAIGTIRRVIEREAEGDAIELREVDVDIDPDLEAEYGERVPYVFIDGRPRFKYRVDESELRRYVGIEGEAVDHDE